MKNTITERELYTQMINGTISQESLVAFAEKKLAQLDKRNASAQRRAAAKRAEGNAITEDIFGILSTERMTREQVAQAYGSELSVAKVGSRLNQLVEAGRVQKETIKVANAEGKMVNKVAYFVAE